MWEDKDAGPSADLGRAYRAMEKIAMHMRRRTYLEALLVSMGSRLTRTCMRMRLPLPAPEALTQPRLAAHSVGGDQRKHHSLA